MEIRNETIGKKSDYLFLVKIKRIARMHPSIDKRNLRK